METFQFVLMAIALLGVVLIAVLELWAKFKGGSVWKAVAQRCGFSHRGSNKHDEKRMSGTHRGVEVWIRGRTDAERNENMIHSYTHYRYFTVFRAALDDVWDCGICIRPRSVNPDGGGKADSPVDFDAFDDAFEISGQPSDLVVYALRQPAALDGLRTLRETFGEFEITNGRISAQLEKRLTSKVQFIRLIDELVGAAESLNRATETARLSDEKEPLQMKEMQSSDEPSPVW